MELLRKFFGRKSNASQTSSAPIARPSTQNVAVPRITVIDDRSEEQRQGAKAQPNQPLEPEIEKLIEELAEIGRTDGFIAKEPGGKFNERNRNIRAREIGEELNRIGGFQLMQTVHRRYDQIVTDEIRHGNRPITGSSRSLDIAWDGIGYWRG